MITAATRAELEESILACCKSLFLTSAIPDLVKQDGTPKQMISAVFSRVRNLRGHA